MLDLGKIIFAALSGDAAISAMIADRIYPDTIPQEIDQPAVSYEIGSLPGIEGSAPIYMPTVNVTCLAREKIDAHALGGLVDAKLEGYSASVAGVTLKWLYKSSYQEVFDPDLSAYGVILTYTAVVVLG